MTAKTNFWGRLITDLMQEKGISERRLAELAKVNRSTLRRFQATGYCSVVTLDRLLAALGYELEALATGT